VSIILQNKYVNGLDCVLAAKYQETSTDNPTVELAMVSVLFMFSAAQLLTKTRCSVGAVHRSPGFGMSSIQQQQSIDQL
jgi:hypothetical protein